MTKNISSSHPKSNLQPKRLAETLHAKYDFVTSPRFGSASAARDQWVETKAFMQERKQSDRIAKILTRQQKQLAKQLARLEKKKRVLDDVIGLSSEELREQLFQARKNHWKDLGADLDLSKRRPERKNSAAGDPVLLVTLMSCAVFGVQIVAIPIALPPALLFYQLTDNIIERRLKKALFAPAELQAEYGTLCCEIDAVRRQLSPVY